MNFNKDAISDVAMDSSLVTGNKSSDINEAGIISREKSAYKI
jgi:hypothetical protein